MVTSPCYQPQCPSGMQTGNTACVLMFVAEGGGIMSSVRTPLPAPLPVGQKVNPEFKAVPLRCLFKLYRGNKAYQVS